MAALETFPPSVWYKNSLFHSLHDSPPPSPFYDVPIHFTMAPTRTASSSHHASSIPGQNNPPRPPNAWILYRSEKLKALPPPPPGMPRRPQADISKTISAMWKTESPEVRSHYERLSDIKKAEHQAMYPNYRFQPMKKADKDRLRAERQAEKERERGTRPSKARARAGTAQEPPPLYTTEARFGPAGPSPPASGASTPPVAQSSYHSAPPQPTSVDLSTLPTGCPSTPAITPSAPSPYPPPPSSTSIPPLVAPQPGVPQRPPSASEWQQSTQPQSNDQEFNSLWIDQCALPDISEYTGTQEYLTVPLPTHPSQQPLGWSPDDPAPSTEVSWNDPLHAVLSATDDPNVFSLDDFDVSQLFDGSREIEVSMGSNMVSSAFHDITQYNAYSNNLFLDLDEPPQFAPQDLNVFASTSASASTSQQQPSGLTMSFASSDSSNTDVAERLASYTFDGSLFDDHDFGNTTPHVDLNSPHPYETQARSPSPTSTVQEPQPASTPTPYVPPTGASNTTRRVAANWRHIRLTPEPEPEPWASQ